MLRKDHLNLIAKHSLKHGLRGGAGLVSIALTLLIGLFLAQCAVGPLERVEKEVDFTTRSRGINNDQRDDIKQRANEQVVKLAVQAMDWVADPTESQLDYWTEDKPAMVSLLLMFLFLATPMFACLGGFNQTAGDIGSKGLRFLLFRTERANIFWGRFLGTFGFVALVNLLLFVILTLYLVAKLNVHPKGDMAMWMMQGYLRMMIFTLPYIALCAWISSAMDSAFGALAISILIAFLVPLVLAIAGGVTGGAEDIIKVAQHITPWGWKYWLLEPVGPKFLGGIAAMFGFTSLFLWFGHRNFVRRDL